MPSPAPRYRVVVRFGDRIVVDRCVSAALSLGDGGDVVVPGLGDRCSFVSGDRVLPVEGLEGEIVHGDDTRSFAAIAADGVVLAEGDRVELRLRAHPELAIALERIGYERVAERDRFFTLPARETLFAGALAGCLAVLLGGKVVIGALTEPEVEPEREMTALELAMFATTPVIPQLAPVIPTVAFVEPPSEPRIEDGERFYAAAFADATAYTQRLRDIAGEVLSSNALPDATGVVERQIARRPVGLGLSHVGSMEDGTVLMLSALSSEDAPDLLGSVERVDRDLGDFEGGVVGGVLGDAVGGVPGGVVGGVPDHIVGEGSGGIAMLGTGGARTVAPKEVPHDEVPAEAPVEVPAESPVDRSTRVPVEVPKQILEEEVFEASGPMKGSGPGALVEPTPSRARADPRKGHFTLDDALAGDAGLVGPGTLTAIIETSNGDIRCELFADRAPLTVANFVGLARGTRESLDPASGRWRRTKFYDHNSFHRVIDGFMIQGGDPTGTGTGGPGYEIADEIDPKLSHDHAGVLAMANKGPNTGGSQFYITVAATPHLDGKHVVFGACDPKVAQRIAKVDRDRTDRPTTPVTISKIRIARTPPAVPTQLDAPHAMSDAPPPEIQPPTPSEPPAVIELDR